MMKSKVFVLLLFLTSCFLSAQIPEGNGSVSFQIYDGIGKQMNSKSPFIPEVEIKFVRNIPGDDSWSKKNWQTINLNYIDVVPGFYDMRFIYNDKAFFEKNVKVLPNKKTHINARHLGRISFEIHGSNSELINKNHKEYPTIQIYDDGFQSKNTKIETSYADVIAGRSYNIKLDYNRDQSPIRKNIEVFKFRSTPLIAEDLGKLEFKSKNHLGEDIITDVRLESRTGIRKYLKSNHNIILAKDRNYALNITFEYPDEYDNIKIEKKGILIEPGNTILVESSISSLKINAINAFGNNENTIVKDWTRLKSTSKTLKLDANNYLKAGTYQFKCEFRNNENLYKTIDLKSGKENNITFKSEYGGLELQAAMANNSYASIPVNIKKDDIVKTATGNQKVKLLPGVYIVEFNFSENNIVEKGVTVIANSTVIARAEFDFGEISITIKNPFGEELKLSGEIIDSKGKSQGQFNTDNSVGLLPGDYTLKFKAPNNQLFEERNFTVISGKKIPVLIELEDYGKLQWANESYLGYDNRGYTLLNNNNIVATGRGSNVLLPAGEYAAVFTAKGGLNITLDNIVILSGKTNRIDLSLGQGKFKPIVKSYDDKILNILDGKIKNYDGKESSVYFSEEFELPIGKHQVKYDGFGTIHNWRTVDISKGNNIDEVRMGRVHFDILDIEGKIEKGWYFRVSSNGEEIDSYVRPIHDYMDFNPGKYNLIFSIEGQDDVERNIEVIEGEITEIDIRVNSKAKDIDSKGQVHMKAFNKDGKEIEYIVLIYKLEDNKVDDYISSESGLGLTKELPSGKYKLIFSFPKERDIEKDIERKIEITEGKITEVVIGEKNELLDIDLNGRWKRDGSTFLISQNGSSINSVLYKVSQNLNITYGYVVNDWHMKGIYDGKIFKGDIHIRFPLEYKKKCPAQWDRSGPVELTISKDGNTLQGKRWNASISNDCVVRNEHWENIKYERVTQLKPSSNFNHGNDGWEVVGGASLGITSEESEDSGNISAMSYNPFDKEIWYFKSPPEYHGNWLDLYEKNIIFKLKTSNKNTSLNLINDSDDVVLKGSNITLVYDIENPGRDWTSYKVPIHRSAGWINEATGKSATLYELTEVLNDVTELLIKGEYNQGRHTTWLDDVEIK